MVVGDWEIGPLPGRGVWSEQTCPFLSIFPESPKVLPPQGTFQHHYRARSFLHSHSMVPMSLLQETAWNWVPSHHHLYARATVGG